MIAAFIARFWPHILIVAIAAAIVGVLAHAIYAWGHDNGAAGVQAKWDAERAEMLEAYAADLQAARDTELARLAAVNAAAEKHAQELEDARQRETDRAAGLAAGNLRLRHEIAALATRSVSDRAAATAGTDAAIARGAELVAAALGVGAACDARQAALIEAYEAIR